MSTDYIPMKDLSYKQMKSKCKDIEFVKSEHSQNKWGEVIIQNESRNCLHFYDYKGKVCSFTRYGSNNVEEIIAHIQFKMGVPIYNEYSDEYHQMFLDNLTEEERKEVEEDMLDE
jgi:Zn-finger domain-containing protein